MTALTVPVITKQSPMTADEFLAFTELAENIDKWFELIRGEVIELPPPIKIHGVVTANLARILGNYTFQRRKGYVTTNDAGVLIRRDPDTVLGPDVALYEDVQRFDDLQPKYGEVPPVLAVEILSASDTPGRISTKTEEYLQAGVKLVWLIDIESRNVTVYRHNRSSAILGITQELTGDDILPGFHIPVADLFYLPGELSSEEQGQLPPTSTGGTAVELS